MGRMNVVLERTCFLDIQFLTKILGLIKSMFRISMTVILCVMYFVAYFVIVYTTNKQTE